MSKLEPITLRVPKSMKDAFKHLADQRLTTESELVREAMLSYLAARGITVDMLRETPPSSKPASEMSPATKKLFSSAVERARRKAARSTASSPRKRDATPRPKDPSGKS